MQITINIPDNLPLERIQQYILDLEAKFKREVESIQVTENAKQIENDPWIEFLENIDQYAVKTGIEDFAKNHDHYLYGVPKHL